MFSRVQPIANSNPRKRLKRAHSSDAEDAPSTPPSYTMPVAPTITQEKAEGEEKSCLHQQQLKNLENDLDSMRQLITCKICQRFLSEPYGLACGHTYCYVCLDAWLVAQKKRTCPDCRATIKQQPVPSFLIREMTRVFAYRAELLPDGETVEEHDEYIKEAVGKVTRDKESGGLFSGLFKHGERLQWLPLHDPGDDVDRCPNCHWELEEGVCGSCGLHIGDEDGFGLDTGDSDESSEGDEVDDDMIPHDHDGMDDTASFEDFDFGSVNDEDDNIDIDIFGALPPPAHWRRPTHRAHSINVDSEPESEDSEDPDNDPQMEGFLDDEEPEGLDSDSSREQSDSEEEAEETPQRRPRQIIRPVVIEESDDDIPQQPRRPVVIDSDDSDEEGPVSRNNQRAGKVSRGTRRPQIQEISSDEDTSNDDGGNNHHNEPQVIEEIADESESDDNSASDNGGVDASGFSPLQSVPDDDSQADEMEGNYGAYGVYDSDASNGEDHPDATAFAADHDDYNDDADDGYGYYDTYDGEGVDADDGGRSTTAGSAPFPLPFISTISC